MWYNEEDFAPYFFEHYKGIVDKFYIILDADTNDTTLKIIEKYSKILPKGSIEYEIFTFPDMMDDDLKVQKLNSATNHIDTDWIIVVDGDEFVFPEIIDAVYNTDKNMIYVNYFQVYRNEKETDLNIDIKPIHTQRRCGPKNILINGNSTVVLYRKPSVFKSNLNIQLTPGNHSYLPNNNIRIHDKIVNGSHWMMADEEIAVKRRVYGRKNRQSKNNYDKGYTVQHWEITEEQIRKECQEHLKDLSLF
jgi:hypothetical protein